MLKAQWHRRWRKRLSVLVGLYLCTGAGSVGYAAGAVDFKTPEYYKSKGLDFIKAADAYALGYTGKDITFGICDQYVYFPHPEFRKKTNSGTLLTVPGDYDWIGNNHGTHVGGIMVAVKDGSGMHGVAYDANLVSGTFVAGETGVNISQTYDAFNKNSKIKIINNSWSGDGYIDEIGKAAVLQKNESSANALASSIIHYDKVLVFSAGNDGYSSPRGESVLPYLKPDTAGNFITVTSIDPAKNTTASGFFSIFSNLPKYVEENSIAAPGHFIYSAVPTSQYLYDPGTSMAAPHVSGVAGLVQQAFPYMNGKQIVDTVLSSANRKFSLPTLSVTIQSGQGDLKLNVYYFGAKPDDQTIADDLTTYFTDNQETVTYFSGNRFDTADKFLAADKTVYGNVPQEMVFGQGLLDAAAAVRGPGLLNARRMDKNALNTNFPARYNITTPQALYTVDTQGYDSEWSNKIGERRAEELKDHGVNEEFSDLTAIYTYYIESDKILSGKTPGSFTQGQEYVNEYNAKVAANGLKNLHVGLIKYGLGTLTLSKDNTYAGDSIAAGGVLQINGSVAGDARSVDTGIIAGNGTIKGSLFNQSIVRPGSDGAPGRLTVSGNLTSTGTIAVAANSTDTYSKLVVAGTADIAGTTFAAVAGSVYEVPVYAGGSTPYTEVITATQGTISGTLSSEYSAFTGMLSAKGKISDDSKSLCLYLVRANNLGTMTGRQQQIYTLMESIFNGQSGMYSLYSLDADKAKQALTAIYGGAQLNQAAAVQSDTFIGTAVTARMDYVNQPNGQNMTFLLPGFAPGTFAVNTIIPMELGGNSNWWIKGIKNWGSNDARQDLPGIDNRSCGFVVGQDRKVNNHWRLGYVMGYGQNRVTSTLAATDSHGYRLGVYGGYSQGSLDLYTYLDYGRHNNHAARYIHTLGLQADSNYNSNTLSLGIGARYNLHAKKDKLWQVSPYADFYISRYNQDGYRETGAGDTYSQIADPLGNTYSTGEIGLEMARTIPKGRYAFHIGYKKVISSNNPEMTVAYTIDPLKRITVSGSEQDREYLVLGLSLQGQLAKNLTIDSQLNHQRGANSRSLTATVTLRKVW